MNDQLHHLPNEQLNARMKELRSRIVEHKREIDKLEQEFSQYERARLISAPHGLYRHHRTDGTDIEVEAVVLETQGEAKYIEYQIPRSKAQRGEEDGYLRWLRTADELARFTSSIK